MNYPPGWTSPSAPVGKSAYDAWETEWSRRVRRMLSAYFSEGFKTAFQPLDEDFDLGLKK